MRDELEQEKRAIFPTFDDVDMEIVKVANSSLYQLIVAKGGTPATELRGMFTTPQKAKEHLDSYNTAGLQAIKAKEEKKKAEEAAVEALLVAEPTKENYAEQRVEKLKKANKEAANG